MLRVFNNLISNSVQATETRAKGLIEIDLKLIEKNIQLQLRIMAQGFRQKRGIKFSHLILPTKTGGTGLGLSMVKNIIEAAGGSIWFESDGKNGTVFYILLKKG